jgi:hypothetical protein
MLIGRDCATGNRLLSHCVAVFSLYPCAQALKLSRPAPEAECTGMDSPCWGEN